MGMPSAERTAARGAAQAIAQAMITALRRRAQVRSGSAVVSITGLVDGTTVFSLQGLGGLSLRKRGRGGHIPRGVGPNTRCDHGQLARNTERKLLPDVLPSAAWTTLPTLWHSAHR